MFVYFFYYNWQRLAKYNATKSYPNICSNNYDDSISTTLQWIRLLLPCTPMIYHNYFVCKDYFLNIILFVRKLWLFKEVNV